MKKAILLFLTLTAFIQAQEPTPIEIAAPEIQLSETASTPAAPSIEFNEKQASYFSYFSVGTCGFVIPLGPEASIGWRKLNTRNAWDVQGGASLIVGTYFWGQASYLHFFLPTTGDYSAPYLGIGLTVGYMKLPEALKGYRTDHPDLRVYANIPITVGHQWNKGKTNQFFQLQLTPLLITTFSYGVGF